MSKPNKLKYYAFDWDDNLLKMPSHIYLKNNNGETIEYSTSEFARKRSEIDAEVKKGNLHFFDKTFIDFLEESDDKFVNDSLGAETAKSWDDFVECINEGHIFAIITSRRHSTGAMSRAVETLINNEKNGLNKKEIIESIKKYGANLGVNLSDKKDNEIIEYYLGLCRFYPINNGKVMEKLSIESTSVPDEKKKKVAMDNFEEYIREMGRKIKNEIGIESEIHLGFSDDDLRNYFLMKRRARDVAREDKEIKRRVYYTGEGEIKFK